MSFCPLLPVQCPPTDADDSVIEGAFRLLSGSTPHSFDWQTHLQRGKACPPTADACRWGSLSFFKSVEAVQKLKKLPNFRSATHVAEVAIPSGNGVHKVQGEHIDFWAHISVSMGTFVTKLVTL
jgi:hypothetical protein